MVAFILLFCESICDFGLVDSWWLYLRDWYTELVWGVWLYLIYLLEPVGVGRGGFWLVDSSSLTTFYIAVLS